LIASLALLGLLIAAAPATTPPPSAPEATTRALHGRLKSAGTRTPIAEATVLAVPARPDAEPGAVEPSQHLDPDAGSPAWVRSVETDQDGRFSFEDLDLEAAGVRLVVIAAGHERHEVVVDVTRSRRRPLVVFAPPDAAAAMRTVVEMSRQPPPEQVSSTSMDTEEIRTAPGTQGDPLRALQNLPGVARTPGGLGLLVLRGAPPSQSRVFMGGHALPRAFHSLATASVVPAGSIDRMEFVPSNFGARYGDATGGLVVLHPAELERDGIHGHGRIDLLGAGASASGSVGRGAYLVAGQRGWVDAVLGAAGRVDPTQPFALPRYYDYQAFFDYPVGPGVLTARVLGAGDRLQTRVAGRNSRPMVVLEMVSQFHRADLSYRVNRGRWSFWLTPSARFERNGLRQPSVSEAIRDDAIMSLRAEATRTLTRRASLTLGADTEVDWYRTSTEQPAYTSLGEPAVSRRESGVSSVVGVYAQSSIDVQQWTLSPGLRASAFTLGRATAAALDPRLSAHWRFAPRWRWSMGVGLYSQSRIQQSTVQAGFISGTADELAGNVVLPAALLSLEPRAGFSPARDGLTVARAAQASMAMGREIADLWFVQLGAWGRMRDNADGFLRDDGAEDVVTSTWSSAYGLEALVRRRLGPKLWGWVGYTLARVEDRILDRVGPPRGPDVSPSAFDQRHNLIAILSLRLPRRWRVGGRFRLVSGSPFTDVAGVIWAPPGDDPIAVRGPSNRARFPTFHQLDLRVDKSWLLQRMEIGAYVDVQNVYNQLNPEAYIYNPVYTRRADAVGLPIFPSIGVRIDY